MFGSGFLYQPMMPNPQGGRPMADPSRAPKTIVAARTEKATFVYPETRSRRGSVVAQEATQDMTIDIANAALPYDPQSGDRLTQLDPVTKLPTGAIYEVNGPQPDGIARNELRVFKIKSGPS